jgi:hypothetical protein
MEDASAQGAMVISTHPCRLIGLLFYVCIFFFFCGVEGLGLGFKCLFTYYLVCFPPLEVCSSPLFVSLYCYCCYYLFC